MDKPVEDLRKTREKSAAKAVASDYWADRAEREKSPDAARLKEEALIDKKATASDSAEILDAVLPQPPQRKRKPRF